MSDDPYFDIVPARPIAAVTPDGTTVADGPGWRVQRQVDGLWLFYISGTHQGDERAILIREHEAEALRNGEATLDAVLKANAAS